MLARRSGGQAHGPRGPGAGGGPDSAHDTGPGIRGEAGAALGVKPQNDPPQPLAPGLQQVGKGGVTGDLLAHGGLDQAFVLPQQRIQSANRCYHGMDAYPEKGGR